MKNDLPNSDFARPLHVMGLSYTKHNLCSLSGGRIARKPPFPRHTFSHSPIPPIGSFNGIHPHSKFLAANDLHVRRKFLTATIAIFLASWGFDSSFAAPAEQVTDWRISSDLAAYDHVSARLTPSGSVILLKRDRSTGVSNIHHFDRDGKVHPIFQSPVNLTLEAYPSLKITGALIPLGGNPASFLVRATIGSGPPKVGFCRITFGRGLSTTYGALGFLETPLAEEPEYLGRVDDQVYLMGFRSPGGAIDIHGNPVFAYGNIGQHDPVPLDAQILSAYLQRSGSILIIARKSSRAPDAYARYLYRIMPDGHLDPRFSNGLLIGRGSEQGLFSYSVPTEFNGQFWFLKFFTTGKCEKYSLDPETAVATKVGEINDLPTANAWGTGPRWSFQAVDGRTALVVSSGTTPGAKFVIIDPEFSSSVSTQLPILDLATPSPMPAQVLPKLALFPEFLLVKISVAGSYHNLTWLRFSGDLDTDGDGIADFAETGTGVYVSLTDTGTSPIHADTDGDGLRDGDEVYIHYSNPNLPDTDGDGFLDGYEVLTGKDPLDPDDKPALVAEIRTAVEYTFPAALGENYRIEASTDLVEWQVIEGGITGTGELIQRFYSTRGVPKRYFRVEVDE